MLHSFFDKLFEEVVFLILLVLLGISLFFRQPSLAAIDWRVIGALWSLMAVAVALEDQRFLDWLANRISRRFHSERKLALALIATSMLLSMFMTNDVALLTLVPITLMIGKRGNFNPFKLVALETVAANVGSSLTPFGNPQNIFLFNQYNLDLLSFIQLTAGFVAVAALGLVFAACACSKKAIAFDLDPVSVKSRWQLGVYLTLFVLAILAIVHILPWQGITLMIGFCLLVLDRKLIKEIDYFLLGTFILFFLLVDNLLAVPGLHTLVSSYLKEPLQVMWFSALSSQLISNVPSAILFEPFVSEARPLLVGVSLGGMGTLIASLANLISWKLYVKEYPKTVYFRYFTAVNVVLFLAVGLVMSFTI